MIYIVHCDDPAVIFLNVEVGPVTMEDEETPKATFPASK